MRCTWWEFGIGAALLLVSLSVNCSYPNFQWGMDPVEGPENAYTCECSLTLYGGDLPDPLSFTICASDTVARDPRTGELNVTDINNDCQGRVATTFALMANTCPDIGSLEATCVAVPAPAQFAHDCPLPDQRLPACDKEEVLTDCSNFNPGQPATSTATLAPGGFERGDEPVCFVASTATAASDFKAALALPTAAPTPMAAGLFGQHSTCVLDEEASTATVTLDGETRQPTVSGVVEFQGPPCPSATCAVGMTYQLEVAPFRFDGFCAGTEITDVRTVGTVVAGALTLNANGVGRIASGHTLTSARGTRTDSGCFSNQTVQMFFVGTNVDPVTVSVDWAGKTCRVSGDLLGTVEEDSDLRVAVDLHGTLVNQPPTANAGADQVIECTSATGTEVSLDGSASHDPDDNLAGARWLQGGRTGAVVGDALQVTLPQGVGITGQYFLRVIDGMAQSAADTTTVQVLDTTAPTIAAVQATPNVLTPPNHAMVPVTVTVEAADTCDVAPVCALTAVTSNEPVNGTGDGDIAPDWELTGPLTVNLRAERAGSGSGRVYTLTVECTDATGNAAQGTTIVTVPHDN